MASITVAFDAGTSGTKVIASYPSGECVFNEENYFLINPSVRQLTEQTYLDLLEYAEGEIGLNSSLVSYVDPASGETVYWEVGEAASRAGSLSVMERKFQTLLVKVLAFLGYLVNLSSKTTEVRLRLGVLLPLDEIFDRELLGDWLRKTIGRGFTVNGCEIKNIVIEGGINCKPEGFGTMKAYPSLKAGILMIGHSDLSWLYFNKGNLVIEKSRTFPGSGMHGFLKTLKFSTSYELLTAELIAKAGEKLEPKILRELTQTKSSDEISLLIKAIQSAHPQYWIERKREFESLEIKSADAVNVAGGAANYFSSQLNQLFQETYGIKLNWCKSLRSEFASRFQVKSAKQSIPLFLDCFGYYKFLEPKKSASSNTPKKEEKRVLEVVRSASS